MQHFLFTVLGCVASFCCQALGNYTKNIAESLKARRVDLFGPSQLWGVKGTLCRLFLALYQAPGRTKAQETPSFDVIPNTAYLRTPSRKYSF